MKVSKAVLEFIADQIESYVDIMETCIITETPPDKFQKQIKKSKKLVKKIRKGDMSCFDEDELEKELPNIERMMKQSQRY